MGLDGSARGVAWLGLEKVFLVKRLVVVYANFFNSGVSIYGLSSRLVHIAFKLNFQVATRGRFHEKLLFYFVSIGSFLLTMTLCT